MVKELPMQCWSLRSQIQNQENSKSREMDQAWMLARVGACPRMMLLLHFPRAVSGLSNDG